MVSSPRVEAIGRVTLVGAGPGDPDLLTMRAVRAIQNADAILFDALIDPAVLNLSRPEARRIDVGKRCGRRAINQEKINQLIVRLALSGAQVVRLKGGDPFVFGRGGEELDSLRAAGVRVDIVPGVTAACAAAASLHVPLTYRDLARSLHFITGHSSSGVVPEYNWRALAESGGTIAAYMASKTFCDVAARLIEAGMVPSTPAVALENVSRPNETHLHGTLASLPALMAANEPAGPTLVLIGEVVALSHVLQAAAQLAA
jgi:uroporphyrin-III C-methyltransferase / precorrin-2 dehydrogenase / sirohydrochlorin ferrochelatase